MSHHGVSIEEIARLVGHASTRTTEIVYRRELRARHHPRRRDHGQALHRKPSLRTGPARRQDLHSQPPIPGLSDLPVRARLPQAVGQRAVPPGSLRGVRVAARSASAVACSAASIPRRLSEQGDTARVLERG